MARGIFRITPRVTCVMRAIESAVQSVHDKTIMEQKCPEARMHAVFNRGDFRFEEVDDETTVAYFDDIEIMFTLLDDTEYFLAEYYYSGCVWLRKFPLRNGDTSYSTKRIEVRLSPKNKLPEGGLVVKPAEDGGFSISSPDA